MVFLAGFILCLFISTLQACPEPQTTVHIQNYDGPIIVHSATCDNQHRNLCNQCSPYTKCEPDCTCVSKPSYYPCVQPSAPSVCYQPTVQPQTACYPTPTTYGCGNQYCNVDDVKVFSVAESPCLAHNTCNRCGSKTYQCQCVGYC